VRPWVQTPVPQKKKTKKERKEKKRISCSDKFRVPRTHILLY
jgi:hypothetical protein